MIEELFSMNADWTVGGLRKKSRAGTFFSISDSAAQWSTGFGGERDIAVCVQVGMLSQLDL